MTAILPDKPKYDIYDVCEHIVEVVEDELTISLEQDGMLVKTTAGKIHLLVSQMKELYEKPDDDYAFTSPLVNLKREDAQIGIVQKLLELFLSQKSSTQTKENAAFALRCLQKIDPMLERVNHRLDLAQGRVAKSAFCPKRAELQLFQAAKYETPLSVRCPTVAYPLPKNLPAYFRHYLTSPVRNLKGNPDVHDRFWKINSIHVGTEKRQICTGNLVEIGRFEGFEVHECKEDVSYKWQRDVVLFTHTGKSLFPSRFAYTNTLAPLVSRLTADRDGDIMEWTIKAGTTEELLKTDVFLKAEETPFCFEGGNVAQGVNITGELYYACGGMNLLYSLLNSHVTLHGREEELFKKMHSLEGSPLFSKERIALVKKRLGDAWFLFAFPQAKEQGEVAKYAIAALELIKEMMAEKLEAPVLFLGDPFETQPEFHLDMFLAFAPDGQVFIQSDEAARKLLKEVYQTHYKKLSKEERDRLKLYFKLADYAHKRNKAKYAAMEAQLSQAGFKVVRVPGIFYQAPEIASVDFFNGIFGISKKGGAFCITNGSLASVDKYLREAFVARMKSHGIDRVYFTGRPSRGYISSRGLLEYTQAQRALVKDEIGRAS